VTIEELEKKFELASSKSIANFSFYLGATNNNIDELRKVDKRYVCGVKIFMGSSTGSMLVDNVKSLQQIFAEVDMVIATHCEKEDIIRENIESFKKQFGEEDIPIKYHPLIRSEEACYRSSAQAIELADKYGSRLHVLHLSTAKELTLLSDSRLEDKKITGEVCVHHLWFTDKDYDEYGARIKWNPSVKTMDDRDALRNGLLNNKLDVVATDHAPHLLSEKEGGCLKAASGGPLVQHSLQLMFEMAHEGYISPELVVEKMCHAPAKLFNVKDRGFIRTGYYADLVLLDINEMYTVTKDNILYKCGWSPFEGRTFKTTVKKTFVNGKLVYDNGVISESKFGFALEFN
jgi:dihydroorotase